MFSGVLSFLAASSVFKNNWYSEFKYLPTPEMRTWKSNVLRITFLQHKTEQCQTILSIVTARRVKGVTRTPLVSEQRRFCLHLSHPQPPRTQQPVSLRTSPAKDHLPLWSNLQIKVRSSSCLQRQKDTENKSENGFPIFKLWIHTWIYAHVFSCFRRLTSSVHVQDQDRRSPLTESFEETNLKRKMDSIIVH